MRSENLRWNRELLRIMLIGFERSYLTVDISSWEGSRSQPMSARDEDKASVDIDHGLGMYKPSCHATFIDLD